MAMREDTITQRELKSLAAGGLIRAVTAVADGDEWALVLSIGSVDRTLTAINSGQVKTWARLDSIRDYLNKFGIREFAVNGNNYHATSNNKRKRPDNAATLRNAHAAAAYDDYVRAEVTKSLKRLDSGEAKLISHEQVEEEMRIIREDLLAGRRKRAAN